MTPVCYLLCFDEPIGNPENSRGQAWHYLGSAPSGDLDRRIGQHRTGTSGVKLMAAVFYAGISFELVRTWPGGRKREIQLKKQGSHRRLCPRCNPGMRMYPQGYRRAA